MSKLIPLDEYFSIMLRVKGSYLPRFSRFQAKDANDNVISIFLAVWVKAILLADRGITAF